MLYSKKSKIRSLPVYTFPIKVIPPVSDEVKLAVYVFMELKMPTRAKVSNRNSFRANHNYSESFRYLYPSQCESFRTNPKNVLYLV